MHISYVCWIISISCTNICHKRASCICVIQVIPSVFQFYNILQDLPLICPHPLVSLSPAQQQSLFNKHTRYIVNVFTLECFQFSLKLRFSYTQFNFHVFIDLFFIPHKQGIDNDIWRDIKFERRLLNFILDAAYILSQK